MREVAPDVGIIAWTREGDDAAVAEAKAAGIRGYVLKQSNPTELFHAMRVVAAGTFYLDSHLASDPAAPVEPALYGRRHERLSSREGNVLRLAASGYGNKKIATDLGISVKTVEAHKWNAMRKLGLTSRIDVVSYALVRGWLSDG
jgi:DNA-binding NarL/FixJ family response regulator